MALNGHRGDVVWFTGLSGSGKSTLAHTLVELLRQRGIRTFVFDGDNVRMDCVQTWGSQNQIALKIYVVDVVALCLHPVALWFEF